MAGHSMVMWGRESAQLLLRYLRTEDFEVVELYSQDGFKMADHLVVTLGELNDCHSCFLGQSFLNSRVVLGRQS